MTKTSEFYPFEGDSLEWHPSAGRSASDNIRPYKGAPLAEYADGRLVLHLEAGYQLRIDGVECVIVSVGVSEITTRPVTDAD